MDEVFFERGEGFSHLERRECTRDIAGNPAVSGWCPIRPYRGLQERWTG